MSFQLTQAASRDQPKNSMAVSRGVKIGQGTQPRDLPDTCKASGDLQTCPVRETKRQRE
jgi:hypothetical protein